MLAAFASVGGNEYIWPSEVLALSSEVAATGGVVSVRGIVTFMSGLEPNRFVVAPEDHPNQRGVEVVSSVPCEDLTCGAVVLVSGVTTNRNGSVSLNATSVNILRVDEVKQPPVAKQADYRRGLLDGRVVTLEGTVREVRPSDVGRAADMLLLMDGYTATVRIPWGADDDIVGEPVRVTGLARAVFKDGKRVDSLLEVEKAEDIVFRRGRSAWRVLLVAAIVLGGILVCVSAVLLVLWLRIVRARREAEVVAAERRRMAADLHDTIEQHLAGANLFAASVMQLEGTPENVKDAMKCLMSLLANAKLEVRSAVLNLRRVGMEAQTLDESIVQMAKNLAKAGVRTRCLLRGRHHLRLFGQGPSGARAVERRRRDRVEPRIEGRAVSCGGHSRRLARGASPPSQRQPRDTRLPHPGADAAQVPHVHGRPCLPVERRDAEQRVQRARRAGLLLRSRIAGLRRDVQGNKAETRQSSKRHNRTRALTRPHGFSRIRANLRRQRPCRRRR